MKNQKISVVIPAYNEEKTIAQVVDSLKKQVRLIVVVDDCSQDNTSKILSKLPVTMLHNSKNLGYTKTLERGVQKAFEMGADYAITFDADGQHDPKTLKHFLKTIEYHKPDLVLGNRDKKNRFMEKLITLYSKQFRISDPFCGLRAISKKMYQRYKHLETRYTIGAEIVFRAAQDGAAIVEIPVIIQRRRGNAKFGGIIKGNFLELVALWNIILLNLR